MEKKGLIIAETTYPVGSMSIRVRQVARGFIDNGLAVTVIIVAPRPTKYRMENSDDFVLFGLKPLRQENRLSGFKYLTQRIVGLAKLYTYLKSNENLRFVMMTRPNILIGTVIFFFKKRKHLKLFFDKGDENATLIDKKIITLTDFLAKQNHRLFDKYFLPRFDSLFVVSSYLEKKYQTIYPHLTVKKCLPTLIDYDEFTKNQNYNLDSLEQDEAQVFKSIKPKVFYAGSCERTNGLFFFLNNAAKLLIHENIDFEIIFIFVDGNVNNVKNYCSHLGISDSVTYLKPVLPKFIPSIYKHIDVLVLPEQGNIIANAGFPGKTGEYLASGKAIISTIFSDLTDHLKHEHNAMLCNIGDDETYINNLRRLILDKDLRESLSANAIRTALEDFNYMQAVKRYIEEL